jgi:hypothetical protein
MRPVMIEPFLVGILKTDKECTARHDCSHKRSGKRSSREFFIADSVFSKRLALASVPKPYDDIKSKEDDKDENVCDADGG